MRVAACGPAPPARLVSAHPQRVRASLQQWPEGAAGAPARLRAGTRGRYARERRGLAARREREPRPGCADFVGPAHGRPVLAARLADALLLRLVRPQD